MINSISRFCEPQRAGSYNILMWKKLKKIHNIFSKKGIILLLICVVSFGLFAPIASTQIAQAFDPAVVGIFSGIISLVAPDFDFLGKVGTPFLNSTLTAFFMLLMTISTLFLEASGALLNWVISPDFITLKFTDNMFVNEAWGIVRDFVNMFFILILVIIGLSTALRIKEYEAQKTLPLLIGMALLINFTPMICGLFIDVSNIIMNFFLDGVGLGLGRGFEQLGISWKHFAGMISTASPASVAGFGFSMALFTFITAFVYLIFAFLFIIRYLALWILVILSPLAFFAYILPRTRGAWNMWWQQFTQWCFVGVGGAFFLYLAELMNVKLADVVISPPASAGNPEMNAITAFFPFLIPIVFLIIGVFATLSTSAIGATQGISVVAKGGRLAGGKALSAARRTETGQRMEGWAQKKRESIPMPIIGTKPGTYQAAKSAERKERIDYTRKLSPKIREQQEKQFGTSRKDKEILRQIAIEKGELPRGREKGTFEMGKKAFIEDKKFIASMKSKEVDMSETLTKRPDLAENVEKQVRKTTPLKFRQETEARALEDINVVSSMDKQKFEHIGKHGKTEQVEAIRKAIGSKRIEELKKKRGEEAEKELKQISKIKKMMDSNANHA